MGRVSLAVLFLRQSSLGFEICRFSLFTLVGLAGYLFALDDTRDNILLNFPMRDKAILLGRLGFCFTLLFGLPLVILPCRDAFRQLPRQIHNWIADSAVSNEFSKVDAQRKNEGAHLVINGVDFDSSDPLLVTDDPEKQHRTMLTYGTTHKAAHIVGLINDDPTATSSDEGKDSTQDMDSGNSYCEEIIHFLYTLVLVGGCYIFAISVPGVGFVWSLAGSSMAITIAFIVPASCYLKIRQHKAVNPRSVAAWGLLAISCIAVPICTVHAMKTF